MICRLTFTYSLVLLLAAGCAQQDEAVVPPAESMIQAVSTENTPKQSATQKIAFSRDIQPILSDKCYACHGPDAAAREAELRLDVIEDGEDYFGAYFAIEPGDPDASDLISRIHSKNSRLVMPPPSFGGVTLTEQEKQLLRQWIEEGAKYEPHWAFVPVREQAVPEVKDVAWPRNTIDAFVLSRLEQNNVKPSPEAPLHTLLRRVSLDLTGLPADPQQVGELLELENPNQAYETYVDELLASPAFGERMASIWLDASRYADTNGYLHDHRRTMWPWRDWVIRAYNDNLPYDVFIRDQIAGDLLPDATSDQILATAFNRNHGITTEGGSIDEEFRVEYAADRINTVGAAILSLTLECARCHDHRYDPISQEDYFSLFSYFNSLENEDPNPENSQAAAHAPFFKDERSGQDVMIMREAATPAPTYVLDRGAYDAPIKDRPVSRRVPPSLGKVPEGAPANRLGLAMWMTADENPLVSRVEVNRNWQILFGTGLVKTSEDFGLQGEWPSHPELLDYLAKRFVDTGWDRKALIRMMVTSATYRQSSKARPDLAIVDPENRLLARMSHARLPAETVRDQAISAAGLLVDKIGGPGVKPYQPDGLWRQGSNAASNTGVFQQGQGDELYRRSVYTFVKRTSPPPQLSLFDAPERDACTVRRSKTNTALQALMLMNDTQHLEAARQLAARAWHAGATDDKRIESLYQLLLTRTPREGEVKVLRKGLADYRKVYAEDSAAAQALVTQGQSQPPKDIQTAELAAWTMLASTLLNLDETVNRP